MARAPRVAEHPELGLPERRKLWQTEGLFSDHYLKTKTHVTLGGLMTARRNRSGIFARSFTKNVMSLARATISIEAGGSEIPARGFLFIHRAQAFRTGQRIRPRQRGILGYTTGRIYS